MSAGQSVTRFLRKFMRRYGARRPTAEKRGAILQKLLIGTSLIVLVSMAATGFAIDWQAQKILTQKANDRLAETAKTSQEEIDANVQQIVTELVTYAALSRSAALTGSQTFDLFTDIAEHDKTISELQLATPDGKYLTYPGSPVDASYDPRQTDWYQGALTQKGPFISDVFQFSQTEFPKLAISLPILTDNDDVKGVVVAFVSVPKLSQLVESMKVGTTGYLFIVDHKGKLLAHPNKTYALSRPALDHLPVVQAVISGQHGTGEFRQGNEPYAAAYVYNPKLRWGIIVAQAQSEIRQDANQLKLTIIVISVICLVVLTLALFVYVRRIVQPVKEVQAKMEQFRDGDLSQIIRVTTNDETRQLADSFNLMTKTLRNIISKITQVTADVKTIAENVSTGSKRTCETNESVVETMELVSVEMERQKEQIEHISQIVDAISEQIATISHEIDTVNQFGDDVRKQARHVTQAIGHLQSDMAAIAGDMRSSQHAFAELNQSIDEVSGVLTWISDISQKTKLLSLNARIEASRAGQAGLGFSVVADEIRKLSEQTEQATGKIDQVLRLVQEKLRMVSNHLRKTDTAAANGIETLSHSTGIFQSIIGMIEELSNRFSHIRDAAMAITERSMSIKDDVNDLSRSYQNVFAGTQQAVASTQESATIAEKFLVESRRLVELVEGLEQEIAYFRTGDEPQDETASPME